MKKKGRVIVVVPLLNEEKNIGVFFREVGKVTNEIKGYDFSFLFVDDGSRDVSWEVLKKLSNTTKKVSAIKLSRNFGSHVALFAGIETAIKDKSVDYVILTTIDMQNPPSLIPKMLNKLKEDVRVVWGYRAQRKEGVNRTLSGIYHGLVRRFALSGMPEGGVDYCLIDRRVAEEVVRASEKNTSIFGTILWLGYGQEMIPYRRSEIVGRKSRWTLGKKIKLLIDTFVSFSYAPLWAVTYLGFSVSTLGFIYAIIIVVRRFVYNIRIEGWSSLMLVVLLLSGAQLIAIGVVSEYLWRTLDASRSRQMYLVDEEINTSK